MPADADLKRKLRDRVPAYGAWTSIGHPSITEIFADAGVDFVGIDLEHSTISQEQSQRIIAAAQAGGVACLPRVASHNQEQVRRLLDSGADGVIVPMVESAEEVARIVAWSKYPPMGRRGYGVARAPRYGAAFQAYTEAWNARSVILIQIESVHGVEAVDDLVQHPAVDGVMVGPYDLSASLGIPGQLTAPSLRQACARVIAACKRAGKACGCHLVEPDGAGLREALDSGYTFVVLASDVFVLWKWAERMRLLVATAREGSGR